MKMHYSKFSAIIMSALLKTKLINAHQLWSYVFHNMSNSGLTAYKKISHLLIFTQSSHII